jgi:hypothetical protein
LATAGYVATQGIGTMPGRVRACATALRHRAPASSEPMQSDGHIHKHWFGRKPVSVWLSRLSYTQNWQVLSCLFDRACLIRPQPLMIRGSSIWWRGQIDFGFW